MIFYCFSESIWQQNSPFSFTDVSEHSIVAFQPMHEVVTYMSHGLLKAEQNSHKMEEKVKQKHRRYPAILIDSEKAGMGIKADGCLF